LLLCLWQGVVLLLEIMMKSVFIGIELSLLGRERGQVRSKILGCVASLTWPMAEPLWGFALMSNKRTRAWHWIVDWVSQIHRGYDLLNLASSLSPSIWRPPPVHLQNQPGLGQADQCRLGLHQTDQLELCLTCLFPAQLAESSEPEGSGRSQHWIRRYYARAFSETWIAGLDCDVGAAGEGEEGGRGEGLKSDMRARENDLFHPARADVVHLSQCGVSVSHATKPFRPFSLHTCMVCAFDWFFPFHGGYFVV